MANLTMLTADALREFLNYDPETGIFTWRARTPATAAIRAWNTKWAGKPAGSPKQGYLKIKVAGIMYAAHRLAWLHVHGVWPSGLLDHRDRVRSNTRIGNLRVATGAQNVVNRRIQKNSKSGVRGVTWNATAHKWQAAIGVRGKSLYLGCYTEKEDAAAAYSDAATLHYGEFAP